MKYPRIVFRSLLIINYIGFGFLLAGYITLKPLLFGREADTAKITQAWLSGLCSILSIKPIVQGRLSTAPVMLLSNHISWLDIPVLGSLQPLRFLSKSEVGQWPLIGKLAKKAGTLFIERGSGKSSQVIEDLAATLEKGETALIFPEGTTTDGQQVKKFHARLLKAAQRVECSVQPVTLHYRRNGNPDSLVPFIDDDEFFSHLLRLLKAPPTKVYIFIHSPIEVTANSKLLEVAKLARGQVAGTLNQMEWQNSPHARLKNPSASYSGEEESNNDAEQPESREWQLPA